MTSLRFFDARTMVGRHRQLQAPPMNPHTVADLLEEMDHCGVAQALVCDSLACENSPADGNPRILDAVRDAPRLTPVWVMLPPGTDETPDPAELIGQMRAGGVGLVVLMPEMYRFPLADWSIDDLLAPLAENRIPLMIAYQGSDSEAWADLVALCRRFPTLPVILSAGRIRRGMRTLYRAMEVSPNLHLELSGYWLHRGIEYLAHRFGSERLLYGSNWPRLNMAATVMTVATADLPEEDRKKIAGENLQRLIAAGGWNSASAAALPAPPPPTDALAAWARGGDRPANLAIFDNHGHLGGHCLHYHVPAGDTEAMLREMDRYGLEQVCVFSLQGVFSDERYGNDRVIDAVQRHPDRFVGFSFVNPHRGPESMIEELQRCRQAGLRGIKLHPLHQGYPEEGPHIDVACQFAHEHRQMILNHDWGGAAQVERLVSTYSQACFFTGHTFGGGHSHAHIVYGETLRRHPNLFICSCPVHEPYHVERIVAAVGAERLLFGSDLTDLPIAWGLGPILLARISEADRRRILSGNLQTLLARYSLPLRES